MNDEWIMINGELMMMNDDEWWWMMVNDDSWLIPPILVWLFLIIHVGLLGYNYVYIPTDGYECGENNVMSQPWPHMKMVMPAGWFMALS